jgi:hypothetical protein
MQYPNMMTTVILAVFNSLISRSRELLLMKGMDREGSTGQCVRR